MAVTVMLSFEDVDGKAVPRPENYPDRIDFPDMESAVEVSPELVWGAIMYYLQTHGVQQVIGLVISWEAVNLSSLPAKEIN